jgi:hypothetical protein
MLPSSDFLPAISILILIFGLLERDGLIIIFGLIISEVALVTGFTMIHLLFGILVSFITR